MECNARPLSGNHEFPFDVLEPTRKRRRIGDIFVAHAKGKYLVGRVIMVDATLSQTATYGKLNLIYMYDFTLDNVDEQIPQLSVDRVLGPPYATNNQGWLQGYYQTIMNRPLESDQVLPQHCFVPLPRSRPDGSLIEEFYDEFGRLLDKRYEPTGTTGVDSFGTPILRAAEQLGLIER